MLFKTEMMKIKLQKLICVPECVPEDLSNPRAATQGDVMAAAGKQRSGTGNQPGEQKQRESFCPTIGGSLT